MHAMGQRPQFHSFPPLPQCFLHLLVFLLLLLDLSLGHVANWPEADGEQIEWLPIQGLPVCLGSVVPEFLENLEK